jgi:hypothetical protein
LRTQRQNALCKKEASFLIAVDPQTIITFLRWNDVLANSLISPPGIIGRINIKLLINYSTIYAFKSVTTKKCCAMH